MVGQNANRSAGVRVSAIVPTWNEEALLPTLLGSLTMDTNISEVVITDNASTDDTVLVANSWGCSVVAGGLPAFGKNAGARHATGDILLFVDADVVVTRALTDYIYEAFTSVQTNALYFPLNPISDRLSIRLCYLISNRFAKTSYRLGRPMGPAPVLAVRSDIFADCDGFDENSPRRRGS
jgi:glycosyltransferase involved in cell wall biosynthesis